MAYAFPNKDGGLLEDCFEASVGEMACTSIIVFVTGYSWKQFCPWDDATAIVKAMM